MTAPKSPAPTPEPTGWSSEANVDSYAAVGKSIVEGVTPADKGWILGFILVVAIIVGSDAWVALATLKASAARSSDVQEYFEMVEANRASQADQMSQVFADQVRRSQEVIRDLAQAVARDSERAGTAALSAINRKSEIIEDESRTFQNTIKDKGAEKMSGLDTLIGKEKFDIVTLEQLKALEETPEVEGLVYTRDINLLAVHCSATPEGRYVDAVQINKWHLEKGWNEVGYHFVILLNGSVQFGRDWNDTGAHVKGRNTGSLGLCYIGGVDRDDVDIAKDTRTPEQLEAYDILIRSFKKRWPNAEIAGHNQFAAKACPSFDVPSDLKARGLAA